MLAAHIHPPVLHLDQHAWTEAHVAARYFGGVPRRLVPDNLKTGVDKPDLYDPKTNKAYVELATHYGCGGRSGPGGGSLNPGREPPDRLGAATTLRVLLSRVTELELVVPEASLAGVSSGISRGVMSPPVRYRVG